MDISQVEKRIKDVWRGLFRIEAVTRIDTTGDTPCLCVDSTWHIFKTEDEKNWVLAAEFVDFGSRDEPPYHDLREVWTGTDATRLVIALVQAEVASYLENWFEGEMYALEGEQECSTQHDE